MDLGLSEREPRGGLGPSEWETSRRHDLWGLEGKRGRGPTIKRETRWGHGLILELDVSMAHPDAGGGAWTLPRLEREGGVDLAPSWTERKTWARAFLMLETWLSGAGEEEKGLGPLKRDGGIAWPLLER